MFPLPGSGSSIYDPVRFAFGVTRSQRPTHRITYGRAGILRQRRNVLTILKRPRRLNPYRSSPIPAAGYHRFQSHSCNRNRDLPRRGGGGPARSSSSTAAVRSRLRSGSSVPVRCAAASCAGGGALLLRLVNQRTGRRGIAGERQRAPHSRNAQAGQCRLSDDATCARRRISVRRSRAKEDRFYT